jgi:hypothetical protein
LGDKPIEVNLSGLTQSTPATFPKRGKFLRSF